MRRITDLSSISAENFKIRNTKFLRGAHEYETHHRHHPDEIRHRIWVVRNSDIRRVIREFPRELPLNEQCAHWMHAVVGKHFFPDANHRTAMALLRRLLRQNGIFPGEWHPEKTRDVTIRSHEVRKELGPITFNILYKEDRLFLVWLLYFNDVLRNVDEIRE